MTQIVDETAYWNALFRREDPWSYSSEYEQQKYAHTLELLPEGGSSAVLEIGCAEGMFTARIAERVDSLLAVDISERALQRAKQRCREFSHVDFRQHDLSSGLPEGRYDLIVCSEVLYYLRDRFALENLARQVVAALPIGGHLLMAHANMVTDDRSQTGFDFNEIGARFIGEIFAAEPELEFVRELRTELYRVQLFRRTHSDAGRPGQMPVPQMEPREVICRQHAPFEHPSLKWGGCSVTAAEAKHCWVSPEVPVLMFHRVASDGPEELAPYRVAPDFFERQLAYLQRQGYHGMTLSEYVQARFERHEASLAGRPVVLSFDDGYLDFYQNAWPLLRRYGFRATVFVPLNFVGGRAEWDRDHGQPARLMDWAQIVELRAAGVEFGAHGFAHRRPWEMTLAEFTEDSSKAKRLLEDRLGERVAGYCYPYAAARPEQQAAIRDTGYDYAVCGLGGNPPDRTNRHYIPRIEVFGSETMDDFIGKLPPSTPAEPRKIREYEILHGRRDRSTYMGR